MERTSLGKTGLKVTRLGFGGIPIQTVGDRRTAVAVVRHAADRGINFFIPPGVTRSARRSSVRPWRPAATR